MYMSITGSDLWQTCFGLFKKFSKWVSNTYTVGHKKTCHFIWDHNSHVSSWIFTLLAPMETGEKYSIGELQNLQLYHNCVSTLSEKILKHTTAHFETNCQCILMLNAINGKNESKWTVFLECVCSKCPPSSRTQAAKRSLHWSTALSMICCLSSFQTVSTRCRSSLVNIHDVQCDAIVTS